MLIIVAAVLIAAGWAGTATAAEPGWWSYSRPATYGTARKPVEVPMRDGVKLACQLTRPTTAGKPATGRFPGLVYEVTPYALLDPFFVEQGDYFASRGYNAITCTVRGTGFSGGTYPQINQPAEQTDAYDMVEWLAAQPWSDGRIGQTGESYGGMSTYRAAASQAPHLRAIAPQQAPNDLFLDDIAPGGVTTRPVLRQWWPLIGSLTSLGRIDARRMYAVQASHPLRDAFWKQIAIDSVLDRVQVPVLAFAGWADPLFRTGALRNVARLDALGAGERTWLIAGPWTHGYTVAWKGCRLVPGCVGGSRVPPDALLAWFDHWVAERPGAPLPSAPVTSFQRGTGWRELGALSDLEATPPTSLELGSDGRLGGASSPAGRRSWRADPADGLLRPVGGLLFASAPTSKPHALLGRPTVELAFTATHEDANLHATLRLVGPGGDRRTISDGWLRAAQRESHAVPSLLLPGERYTARWQLAPIDAAIPTGSRFELRLDSGSATAVVPMPRALTVTAFTGPGGSRLELPLR